jgi:hypothetical protein
MQNTIIHLIGTPGVGKYTIGGHVTALTGARFVDNHSVANVIFNLLPIDGVTPLPEGVWERVGRVRAAVLDTVAHLSPPEMSFVFTNYMRGADQEEYRAFLGMMALADARGSVFVPIILTCDTAELRRRIVSPSRRERMKMVDPVQGARLNELPEFDTDHPNKLRLDVTAIDAVEAARLIVEWAHRCKDTPREN